jgi:acyl carrier protein
VTSSPSEEQVLEKVRAIVIDALRVDPKSVTRQSDLLRDFGAESIDIVDIRFRVEDTFGFKFGQQEMKQVLDEQANSGDPSEGLTLEHMVNYILRRVREQVGT